MTSERDQLFSFRIAQSKSGSRGKRHNHIHYAATPRIRACSHYSQRFDDECKAEKRQENDVQFFKT